MVKRRSLDDALTPEEQAFLNTGAPTPAKPKQKASAKKPKPKPTPKEEETVMARPAVKEEFAPRHSAPSPQPQIPGGFSVPGVVSLNTRIDPEISAALLTASMQRKIQRLQPFTQQDIVAEALRDWLRKNGFLTV